jgi:hypothetical protein
MGIGRIFRRIARGIGKAVKAVGKVAKNVFTGKIGKVFSSVMSFIPGLNAGGLIGKALGILGKGSKIQGWLKGGLNIFQNIAKKFGLSDKVSRLTTHLFQPIGKLAKFAGRIAGGVQKTVMGIAGLIRNRLNNFQNILGRIRQLGTVPQQQVSPQRYMPQNWGQIHSRCCCHPQADPAALQRLDTMNQRLDTIGKMLAQLNDILNPHRLPQPGSTVLR